MRPTKAKVAAVGVALIGGFGVVAAVLQWWQVAAVVAIALQTVAVIAIVARRTHPDIAKTRRAVQRVERRLDAAGARASAVDEQIRADIADRLAELTETAASWRADRNRVDETHRSDLPADADARATSRQS